MIRVCSRLDSSPNLYTRLNTKPGLPGLQLFAHTSIRLGPGTCPGPEFLSIQISPRVPGFSSLLYTLSTRNLPGLWKFEYTDFARVPVFSSILYTPQNRNLPGPGKFEYTDFARGPVFSSILYTPWTKNLPGSWKFEYTDFAQGLAFRAFCIRPRTRICLAPENLSIQILPWAGLFELFVYAPNREPDLPRKIRVYCIRQRPRSWPGSWIFEYTGSALGPVFSSILYTPLTKNLPGPWIFEYTDFAQSPGFLSIQVYASDQEPTRARNFWVYRFRPGPWIFEPSVYARSRNLPRSWKFEYTDSARIQALRAFCIRPGSRACSSPENLSIQILPRAQFFRVYCIRYRPRTCLAPENSSIQAQQPDARFPVSSIIRT